MYIYICHVKLHLMFIGNSGQISICFAPNEKGEKGHGLMRPERRDFWD